MRPVLVYSQYSDIGYLHTTSQYSDIGYLHTTNQYSDIRYLHTTRRLQSQLLVFLSKLSSF